MSLRGARKSDKYSDSKKNSLESANLMSGRKGSQTSGDIRPVIPANTMQRMDERDMQSESSQLPVLKVNRDNERIQVARRKFSQSHSIKASDSSPMMDNSSTPVMASHSPRQRPPLPHSISSASSGIPKPQPRVYGGSGRVGSACSVLPSTSSSKISQSPQSIASIASETCTADGIFNFQAIGSQSSLTSKTSAIPNAILTPRSPQSGKSVHSHISGSGVVVGAGAGAGGRCERFLRVRTHLVHQPSNESCESSFSYTSNISNTSGVNEEADVITSCSTGGSGYETERSTSKHCSRTSSPHPTPSTSIKSGTSSSTPSVTKLSVSKWQKALLAVREWKRRGSVKKRVKDGDTESKSSEYIDPVYQTLKSAAKERNSTRLEPKGSSQ